MPGITPSSAGQRYTTVAILLHWIMALAIFGAFVVGLYMDDLPPSPWRLQVFTLHKWGGITILLLAVLRLLWRLTHRPPPLAQAVEQNMSAPQRAIHKTTLLLLYALCFIVPLTGWAYSSASGYPIVWLGILPLPDWVPVNRELAHAIKPWHGYSAFLLVGLSILHTAAALKHQFIDKDNLLNRMRLGR